jgi:hypothetical protein
MAELADAAGSKLADRNIVGVRIPLSLPNLHNGGVPELAYGTGLEPVVWRFESSHPYQICFLKNKYRSGEIGETHGTY